MSKWSFITTARTKKAAESAKRHYTKRGVPIEIRAREDGTYMLLTPVIYHNLAHSMRSGRAAR